jgi:hypothetical protein
MSGCVVKFRGAHIQHDYLKAGIAVLPAESDRSYARHYVPKPIIPETGIPEGLTDEELEAWLSSLPTRMELNPVFTHFIRISPATTLPQLEAELQRILTPDVLTSADAFLSDRTKTERRNSSRFRKLMQPRERLGSGLVLPGGYDARTLLAETRAKFRELGGELDGKGKILPVEPGTIDIGAAAIDRGSASSLADTFVGKENPANASGTLTYCEIFMYSEYPGTDVWIGTFIDGGSNVLSCRDSESIGAVSAGSKQTFSGLSINVATGDYFGTNDKGTPSGSVERDSSGQGYWRYVGECIDPSDSQTFTWYADRTMSLYGEGEEGATEKESSDAGTGTDTVESLETPEAKTSSDTGAGTEGSPTTSATLAGSESGSSIEALISRLLADDESGGATEASDAEGEEGSKDLSVSEPGEGADRLVAKIEMPAKGGGMKLWI